MNNIKILLFDFGSVLYKIDLIKTFNAFQNLSEDENFKKSQDFIDFYSLPLFLDYECGLISTNQFLNELENQFKMYVDKKSLINAWNELLLGLHDNSIKVLKKLNEKYPLYLLSNTNELHFSYFSMQCKELFELFEKLYLSFELKTRKPDIEIFEQILKDLKFLPDEILFIDDLQINLDTASNLGFNTFLVNDEHDLDKLIGLLM